MVVDLVPVCQNITAIFAPKPLAMMVLLARRAGPQGLTCYYYGPRETVYEKLGHAEVVQLELNGSAEGARKQMEVFADVYFSQFKRTPFGMIR